VGKLKEALQAGRFVVTAEVGPPKGVDMASVLEDATLLWDRVDAINVTDQQSAVMRLGSLAVCHLLAEKGMEPVFQLTCRDRNRIALQSDLLSAYVLNIENVLCLTGDYVTLGDHPQAKAVFDLDAVSLLEAARSLQEGQDLAGKELTGTPKFFLGATVSPGANPLEPQLVKMERKVRAGAQFFQTQGVFEPDKFERFMREAEGLGVPILAGIILLKSAGMARFMNRNVAGVHVPETLIEEMEKAEDKRRTSVEIAGRLINELRPLCQGVHIMAIGWEKQIPAVLEAAGLSAARPH
jgi:5,10-methylenetetrahydrofolate reductase